MYKVFSTIHIVQIENLLNVVVFPTPGIPVTTITLIDILTLNVFYSLPKNPLRTGCISIACSLAISSYR
jgi:hypothetical protein